ncbi:MAG TPA: hypothetical protein PK303_07235, partial [bacterium]|nr:hypothetical protein [bacterium]HOL34407.1 hypothetical protein [bacterium]HPP08894.1 hypothetical protein [bacterium]
KLLAEEMLINSLPVDITVIDMESFGDFWRKRDSYSFMTDLLENGNNKKLKIMISNGSFPADDLTLYIKNGKFLSEITATDENSRQINFTTSEITGTPDILLYGFSRL